MMTAAGSSPTASARPADSRPPPAASSTSSGSVIESLRLQAAQCSRRRALFWLKRHVPILEWLPSYDVREDLPYDAVAGVTVGLMIVPQEISLASIMGVPAIYGLYTAALVPMVYPLFGTSRVLSVANGAEVSLLVGSAIRKVESEEERVATGILLSFLVGLFLLLMGVFRLGVIADFFSRPVMGGFISAGGVLIMLSQCANWFGVTVKSHDLPLLTVFELIEQAGENMNALSFLLGLISILVLVGMRELKRRVVRQLARLEELLEDEFALATSHAMQQSSDGDLTSDGEDAADVATPKRVRPSQYEDVELGDSLAASPANKRRGQARGGWTNVPAMLSTGTLKRSDFVLTSPWTATSSRRRDNGTGAGGGDLDDLDTQSCRPNRPRPTSTDDGIGLSLSDEDYITRERPLDFSASFAARRTGVSAETPSHRSAGAAAFAGPPNLSRSTSDSSVASARSTRSLLGATGRSDSRPSPRRRRNSSQDDKDSTRDSQPPTDDIEEEEEQYSRNLSSSTKSTASLSDSTCSTTALTGRALESLASSSMAIRILRSKIAVLIALRLVCELGAFLVCVLGGLVGYVVGPDDLKLTGNVPGGYPSPLLPWYGLLTKVIEADRLYHIIIDTLSIAIISYMASIAIGKRLAIKEGYRIRPNQELIALGLCNLFGSFFQSMPATGGLSRTAVNMQNARTQLASLITVLVVVLVLYTATSTLAYLPKTSLSAIIIVAGYSLIETKEAKWLYRVKRDEFYVWLASFSLTCLLGVLPGLLSSIFCSLIAVIYKTRRPTVTMLGQLVDEHTGAPRIVDLDLFPDTAQPLSDVVVIRVEGALYFANCEYIERVVEREIAQRHETEDVRVLGVVIDAGSIMEWDSTTIQMMKHLKDDLRQRTIQLAIVNARDRLQNLLESSEFLEGIVRGDARIGFNEAIAAIRDDADAECGDLQVADASAARL